MQLPSTLPARIRAPLAAAIRPARRALSHLRDGSDRRLHSRRHRRVREHVLTRGPVRRVLFVCFGNICRSPYAEFRLRAHLDDAGLDGNVDIRSVGFISPGRGSPPEALRAAAERGLDLSDHRSAVLTAELLRDADLILAMTSAQQRDLSWNYGRRDALHLGDVEPPPIPRRDLPDPVDRPIEDFRAVYARIDRALEVLGGWIEENARPIDAGTASNDGTA